MSQLVACLSNGYLLLASDRRVAVGHGADARAHSLRKLFALGPAAAVATSGAAVGVAVSRTLSRLFLKRAALPLAELEAYVLSVFQGEYDEFQEQGEHWFAAHPEAHRSSYVLLGGRDPGGAPSFSFFASEAHGEPYRRLRTGSVLTAPRRLGFEGRLGRAAAAGAPEKEVRHLVLDGLARVAEGDEAVAGPFDVAVVDGAGVRMDSV